MRTLIRPAAAVATLAATSTLVGGGIAQAGTGPASAGTGTAAQAPATTGSEVGPQETFHSWYWERNNCVRAGMDLMGNEPWITDYRCQPAGFYWRLLVTYS